MKKLITFFILLTSYTLIYANNSTPQETVNTYYKWYMNCLNKDNLSNPCYYYKPTSQYVTKELLNKLKTSDIDYDYFLSTQDFDYEEGMKSFTVRKVEKSNSTKAKVSISMSSWGQSRKAEIYLNNVEGKWKINKVDFLN